MVFEEFDLRWPNQPARFNVAPSQLLPAIDLTRAVPVLRLVNDLKNDSPEILYASTSDAALF